MAKKALLSALIVSVLLAPLILGGAAPVFNVEIVYDNYSLSFSISEGAEIPLPLEIAEEATGAITWRTDDGNVVIFPYKVSADDANGDRTITITGHAVENPVCVGVVVGDVSNPLYFERGTAPDLPTVISGHTVEKYYVDEDFSAPYVPSPLTDDFNLYPLFTDFYISVTLDGESRQFAYGEALEPKENTDTHDFVGYFDNDGRSYDRVTKPGDLSSRYERRRFRITVGNENFYVDVGSALNLDDLAGLGDAFYRDEGMTFEVTFPFVPNDDVRLYPKFSADENDPDPDDPQQDDPNTGEDEGNPGEDPGNIENNEEKGSESDNTDTENGNNGDERYATYVQCEHGQYTVEELHSVGDIVEVTISEIEAGYEIKEVLAECDGYAVTTMREGNVISFIAPAGDVTVTVIFQEATVAGDKKALDIEGIIALSLTAFIFLAVCLYMSRNRLRKFFIKAGRARSARKLKRKAVMERLRLRVLRKKMDREGELPIDEEELADVDLPDDESNDENLPDERRE